MGVDAGPGKKRGKQNLAINMYMIMGKQRRAS
jgi:hypothetical protein